MAAAQSMSAAAKKLLASPMGVPSVEPLCFQSGCRGNCCAPLGATSCCNQRSSSALGRRCHHCARHRDIASGVVALENDREVIAHAPLDPVTGAIDDVIADPHGARAAAVEVQSPARVETA